MKETDTIRTDRNGRITINPQKREQILQGYHSSGLSQMAYAKKCGINYTTFAGWVQRERRREKSNTWLKTTSINENRPRPEGFAQVELSLSSKSIVPCWGWEVELGDSALIRISSDLPLESVAYIVNALKSNKEPA